jgi:SagB-type dehydrogenase family enzyme
VELDRRAFLALVGSALGWAEQAGGAETSPRASARDIHRMTRNTWLGALGARPTLPFKPLPFKLYPGATRLKLPSAPPRGTVSLEAVVRGYRPSAGFGAGPLSLAELARVLRFANGVTARPGGGKVALRAAPSAGALYAGEIYVVAERVHDLEPGVYYYAVLDHALVRVRSGSVLDAVAAACERASSLTGAAAAVVLTNVFARYARRYANRGYRYALIDSGHIGANLRLTAHALGLSETSPTRFEDDSLNRLLEIDGRREAVCALHGLGRPGAASPPGPRRALVEQGLGPRGLLPHLEGALERGHEATKLVPGSREPEGPHSAEGLPGPAGPTRALPPAPAPGIALERCIELRRSAARFLEQPITLEDISFVLEMAAGHSTLERAPGLELRLVVHRVRDLAPGVYQYDPSAHALRRLREAEMGAAMVRICLAQKRAGTAAVGFVLAGRLRGGRDYRSVLLEAGEVAQRVYLAAEALGLAARNLAAFVDDSLDDLVGLDGHERGVVHLTMLGPGD